MIFFPAIDLKDGNCVRLRRGKMKSAKIFGKNPAAQAQRFQDDGCSWVHVVDLNGAFKGRPINDEAVESILSSTEIKIELGGGIRDLLTIEHWIKKGVSRIVLGTMALKNPQLVEKACKMFPQQIAVGIDAINGFVATEGWAKISETAPLDLARQYEDVGVAAIIYTDIDRDGLKSGVNVDGTVELAHAVSVPVIASGGVASLEDLENLKNIGGDVLEGVIAGRAVYDGSIDPSVAVTLLKK